MEEITSWDSGRVFLVINLHVVRFRIEQSVMHSDDIFQSWPAATFLYLQKTEVRDNEQGDPT